MKRTEDSLRDLWDNIKCTNFRIIGVPEEEEKKKGYEKIFQGIFPTQGLNPRLLRPALAGGFFTAKAVRLL